MEDNQEYTKDVNNADNKKKPRQRPQNKNIIFQEKFVFIREYCEHVDKYYPNNKGKF